MRIPAKINQLFIYNKNKINKTFQLFNFLYEKDYYQKNSFKIINNVKQIPFRDNFILSGMNLAFLGYFANKEVYTKKVLFHWPDGIWLKKHIDIKKMPGRDLIKNLKIPKNIDNILVLGNLSEYSKKFLKKKFKLNIFNQKLPFGSIEKIMQAKIRLKKKSLILITLPTPKQEKLAYHISRRNLNYKIICIGASIAIASGEEKKVPNLFKNYEFLWRLRNDFFRRSKRIVETFFYYLKGKYINKVFHKTRFIKID